MQKEKDYIIAVGVKKRCFSVLHALRVLRITNLQHLVFLAKFFLFTGAEALFDFGHPWPQPFGQFSVGKAVQFYPPDKIVISDIHVLNPSG